MGCLLEACVPSFTAPLPNPSSPQPLSTSAFLESFQPLGFFLGLVILLIF